MGKFLKSAASLLFGVVFVLTSTGCKVRTASENLSGTYPVEPGGKLVMRLSQGAVDVQTADIAGVTIHVTRKMTSLRGDPKEALTRQKIEVQSMSNELRIGNRRDSSGLPRLQLGDVTDYYEIKVPKKFSVDIESGVGGIRVGSIEGNVSVKSAADGIAVDRVDGRANLVCSGGDIHVQEVTGELEVRNSGGTIEVGSALGGITAKSSGGDITVTYTGENAELKTAGGDIEVAAVGGGLEATTAGGDINVEYKESPKGDGELKTAGGNVEVVLPANASFDIDAKSAAGDIETDFNFKADNKSGSSSGNGSVNGGGKKLRLRSSGGNIYLRTKT
ncbi:MAG TPA: DUF4097 family beta strand repeat-containing protein [Chthoniobacterales bacterium]